MPSNSYNTRTQKSIAFVRSHITRMVTFGVILTIGICFSFLYMKQPIAWVITATIFIAIAFIFLLYAKLGYLLKLIEKSCIEDFKNDLTL